MRYLTFILLPLLATAAACSDPQAERAADAREAEGEVLGGSISDEMLPLDQLRSQSPTIREAPPPSEAEQEGDDAGSEGEGGESPATAPPETPETPEL